MESRAKRVTRAVGPVEVPNSPVLSSEQPGEVPVDAAAAAVPSLTPLAPIDEPQVRTPPPISAEMPGLDAAREEVAAFGGEALSGLAESRRALAAGFEALGEELAGLARCGIDTAARTAIGMLAVRTVSDAVAVNAGFVRASFDNWIGRSARFSELGAKLAADSSRLFLERLGSGWTGLSRTRS
jgi:hypothetical protein